MFYGFVKFTKIVFFFMGHPEVCSSTPSKFGFSDQSTLITIQLIA